MFKLAKKINLKILIILCLVTFTFAISYARYTSDWNRETVATIRQFYFTSDYLSDSEETPQYDIYDWEDGITISLNNYKDLNVTDENIEYTYVVENGTVNGNKTGTGIIEGGTKNNSCITIIPNHEVTQVAITVTSTVPSEKTIKAIFNLISTGSQSTYSYTDYGDYGILMIKTGNSLDSDISVNYSGLYADNNSFINATGENGTILLTDLEANSTYEYTFFESIENDYRTSGIITGNSINI